MSSFYGNTNINDTGPSEDTIKNIITNYVTEHPELIGVQDGSVTINKLATSLKNLINGKQDALTIDTELSSISENPVQNKVINNAINILESNSTKENTVAGSNLAIAALPNTRYICSDIIQSLNFTPPAAGITEIIFTTGQVAPTVTLPATVKMPEWYEILPNVIYEISILDGIYGTVMSWTV